MGAQQSEPHLDQAPAGVALLARAVAVAAAGASATVSSAVAGAPWPVITAIGLLAMLLSSALTLAGLLLRREKARLAHERLLKTLQMIETRGDAIVGPITLELDGERAVWTVGPPAPHVARMPTRPRAG